MHSQLTLDLNFFERLGIAQQSCQAGPAMIRFDRTPPPELPADEPGLAPASIDKVLQIHDYERRRLGHELHDSTGQLLIVLELSIAHLKEAESGRTHQGLLAEIQETVKQIDREIRTLAFLDYPAEVSDRGLSAALQSLARGLQSRTGMPIDVEIVGDMTGLNDLISLSLLRVAQEALTNVHRHAHATRASIILKRQAGALELIISDNGVGMRVALERTATIGIGLMGMQHRVETIGGSLKISNLYPGTRVSVSVPLEA